MCVVCRVGGFWLRLVPDGVVGGVGVVCGLCGSPVVCGGVLCWLGVGGCVGQVGGCVRWFCFLLRCCMICVLVAVDCWGLLVLGGLLSKGRLVLLVVCISNR